MKSIFVTHTPYHVLLSCAVASTQGQLADNHLFLTSDFEEVEALVRSLELWSDSPFASVHQLPGLYGQASGVKRRLVARRNVEIIRRFVARSVVGRVYVFNDGRPEAQTALHMAKKRNKKAMCVYIEDGAEAYNSHVARKRSRLKLLVGKLLYGCWWEDVSVLGTSGWIDEIMASLPQFVRPELRSKPVFPISRSAMLDLRKQELPYRYLEMLGMTAAELKLLGGILLIAHSETARQAVEYGQTIKELIAVARDQNLKLAVKYHPREPIGDFLSIGEIGGSLLLPQSLPIELAYLMNPGQIQFVGGMSTSLLTAKWLLDNTTVVSLEALLGHVDPQLLDSFHKLGIIVVDGNSKLKGIFQ